MDNEGKVTVPPRKTLEWFGQGLVVLSTAEMKRRNYPVCKVLSYRRLPHRAISHVEHPLSPLIGSSLKTVRSSIRLEGCRYISAGSSYQQVHHETME